MVLWSFCEVIISAFKNAPKGGIIYNGQLNPPQIAYGRQDPHPKIHLIMLDIPFMQILLSPQTKCNRNALRVGEIVRYTLRSAMALYEMRK